MVVVTVMIASSFRFAMLVLRLLLVASFFAYSKRVFLMMSLRCLVPHLLYLLLVIQTICHFKSNSLPLLLTLLIIARLAQ